MKINSRHYILIIFALLSIVAALFSYFFIYNKTLAQVVSYVNVNEEVNNEDSRKKSEEELLNLYESSKESRAKVLTYFVQEDKIVDFIEKVESIGDSSKTKLEISSISNDANSLKAKIKVEGGWVNVMTAFTLIENLPISLSIGNVSIRNTDFGSKTGRTWSLDLDIEALIKK
jgi:hypothetical protein